MPVRLRSSHHDATAAVGAVIGAHVVPGDVVVLTGPLGAGKTRLVQGLARGLGVPGRVTSPTFVLVRRHVGRLPLVHVDAYRLDGAGVLATLDDDVLADDVVTCIEWGEHVAAALPDERLDVELAVDGDVGDAPRLLVIDARSPVWADRAPRLAVALAELAAADPALMLLGSDA
jgi:tRNA threonylcarbamoyladenosine biosynthesis protein TsaE